MESKDDFVPVGYMESFKEGQAAWNTYLYKLMEGKLTHEEMIAFSRELLMRMACRDYLF